MAQATLSEAHDDPADGERASKRIKLLSDEDDSDQDSSVSAGGVALTSDKISINNDYAERFQHNAKRRELHQLEEKYGKQKAKRMQDRDREDSDSGDSSSASEDEDGGLASGALEADFNATLKAIKNKDPRIYQKQEKFYNSDDEVDTLPKSKTAKPMFLSDYHRQNLTNGVEVLDEEPLTTYDQQQDALKNSIVREMHAAKDSSDEDNGDMLQVKRRLTPPPVQSTITSAEVDKADQDPENYLSKFLESRAWATGGVNGHAFESDDEEEDARADAFEEAYNLRFEKADGLNEKLVSHARDAAAKYSVRGEAKSGRQRKRDAEKAVKEEAKAERNREKAQLKKLRLEQMDERLAKISEAAGQKASKLKLEEWSEFLAEDWDDATWEQQMKAKFDDGYYAERDSGLGSKSKKISKPEWDDDLDVDDIVADFQEDEAQFSLTDEEEDEDEPPAKKQKKSTKEDDKKEAKRNKRKLEQLVEEKVNLEMMMGQPEKKGNSTFRYRETSPVSWGLSSKDILLASDEQLNQFAGLKKIASFREPEKRKHDKKKLGKKARLRQWRKETFGNPDGPKKTIQDLMVEAGGAEDIPAAQEFITVNGDGKRKRSKKSKAVVS